MPSSVPAVIPLEEWKRAIAKYLELAVEYKKLGGDSAPYKDAIRWARRLYEEKMKEAANLGRIDQEYVNRVGKALDRVEARWRE